MTSIYTQYVGWSEVEMELSDGARLSGLLAVLAEQAGEHGNVFFDAQTGFPSLEILTVVNGAASPGRTVLRDGDVVTLMPPMAGGCHASQGRLRTCHGYAGTTHTQARGVSTGLHP